MWILWSVFLITEKCYQTQHEGLLLRKHLVYLPHCWTVRHAMLQIIPRHAIWQQGGQPTAPYYKLSPDMSYDNREDRLQCLTTNYPQTCHMNTGRAAYSALLQTIPRHVIWQQGGQPTVPYYKLTPYDNREGSLHHLTTNYPTHINTSFTFIWMKTHIYQKVSSYYTTINHMMLRYPNALCMLYYVTV